MICQLSGTAGSRCSETVVRNLLGGDFFPVQLPCRSKLTTACPSGLDTSVGRTVGFPNVPVEALGWDPLATPEAVSLTLGMEHSYWPEVIICPP